MLALSTLDPTFTAIVLLVAFVSFVVAAILTLNVRTWSFWVAVGLALWVFVSAWNALAAA